MSIDLGELEYEIRNSQDLSHVAPETVLDLIAEVRHSRVMASANQGAIVNSIIERTQGKPSDAQVLALIRELRLNQGDESDWTEDLFARSADALERLAAREVADG